MQINNWEPLFHVSLYEEKELSRMDAIKAVARERGVSKSVVYNAVMTEASNGKKVIETDSYNKK